MKLKEQLIKYVDAGYPIIFINSFEEIKTDAIIKEVMGGREGLEWNGAKGFVDFRTKQPLIKGKNLVETLRLLDSDNELDRKFLVLKDAIGFLEEQEVTALLKDFALQISQGLDTVIVIVSSIVKIPKELEKFITIVELEYPTQDEIKKQIGRFSEEQDSPISDSLLEEMSISFKGLTEFEIESLLATALAQNGMFTRQDLNLIFEQRQQMIMKSGILEMIPLKERPDDIGGLESLKTWLRRKAKVYKSINKAMDFGVDMPKGVLIAGVPGCGKSLAAKVTAQLFEVPLL